MFTDYKNWTLFDIVFVERILQLWLLKKTNYLYTTSI